MSEPTAGETPATETPEPAPPPVSAEVALVRPRNTLSAKVHYAKELAQSGMLPAQYRDKPANVLWATEYGEMLGLSAMAAIVGIHVIEGRPTASAALVSSLVRKAGHRIRTWGNDEKATTEIVRSDDPTFTFRSEWDLARAKKAGLLGKGTWTKFPAALLKARTVTEAARDACQEVLMGVMYTPEELGVEVDEDGLPTGPTVVEQVEVDWEAEIRKCGGSRERLLKLWQTAPNAAVKAKVKAAAEKAGIPPKGKTPEPPKLADKPAEDEPETVDAEIVEDEPVNANERLDKAIRDNGWDVDKIEDLFIGQHGAELAETTNEKLLDSFRESLYSLSDSDLKADLRKAS